MSSAMGNSPRSNRSQRVVGASERPALPLSPRLPPVSAVPPQGHRHQNRADRHTYWAFGQKSRQNISIPVSGLPVQRPNSSCRSHLHTYRQNTHSQEQMSAADDGFPPARREAAPKHEPERQSLPLRPPSTH